MANEVPGFAAASTGGEGREVKELLGLSRPHRTEKTHGICCDLASAKKMMEKRQKVVCSPSSRTKPCCFRQKVCYPEVEPWYLDGQFPSNFPTVFDWLLRCSDDFPYSTCWDIYRYFPIQHVPYIQNFGIIFVPIYDVSQFPSTLG